jgi:hypothetical protein
LVFCRLAVHVRRGQRIDPGDRCALQEEVGLEGAQVAEVEDRPEVDVEAVGALAGEDGR